MIADFKTRLYCADTNIPRQEVDVGDPLWERRITSHFDGARGFPPARDPLDDSEDARRNPYLSRSDMRAVLARSLALYRQRNGGSIPQRVVVHKTTAFEDDELAGVSDALTAVRETECVQVTTDVKWRGVWLRSSRSEDKSSEPDGYPVHRGTMVPLSGTSAIVWVAGNAPSVARRGDSYYQGGKSIPSPLLMTRQMGRGPLGDHRFGTVSSHEDGLEQ